ncbi:MAG: DUF6551 family protein [Oscillospiraceae bacterium]
MLDKDYSRFVPNVHFEQIPIKNLVSNQEYQRNLSQSHIERAAKNFDLYQINPVKVSRRDGINYVFNGQHTIEIVAMVSESRDTPVWCMVYDDMDYNIEADVFANQQKYVKSLVPYEIFKANLEAGNDKQIMIKSLVESYGLTIGPAKGPGVICAVSSLEYIFDTWGFHVLDRTLRLCIGTWEGETNSLSSNILKGIAKLIVAFGEKMRDDIFKEKVGAYSAKDIIRTAKERRAGTLGYAEAMLIAYNKKMKYPLRWSNLYTNQKVKETIAAIEIDVMRAEEEDNDKPSFFDNETL